MKSSPPRIFWVFFRWFCHRRMLDYIEGDLMEVYERNLNDAGKWAADRKFVWDVILLFRPGIIRPFIFSNPLSSQHMYQSYFKICWRTLLRNRQYSLLNVLGLALSLTICILIFGIVQMHLSVDDFHPMHDRTYRIVTELRSNTISPTSGVPTPLPGLILENESFAEKVVRHYQSQEVYVLVDDYNGQNQYKETNGVVFTEPVFFEVFDFPLKSGDLASALSYPNSAALTEELARKYFGDDDPIGKSFSLNGENEYIVRAVLESFPSNTDFKSGIYLSYSSFKSYMPWLADEGFWSGVSSGLQCYVVLSSPLKESEAVKALAAYSEKYPIGPGTTAHYSLQPLTDIHFNSTYGATMDKKNLWILAAIGFFLLVTACLNFVNMATAKALQRSREVGVRKTMGGLRGQLFWQFIMETGLITLISIAVSLIAAFLLIPQVNTWFGINLDGAFLISRHFLVFVILICIAVTVLGGFYPAIVMGRFSPITALKGKPNIQQLGGFNTRRSLLVGQFVIAQVMIIAAIVIMGQMKYVMDSDLGFEKDAIVIVNMGSDSLELKKTLKNEILRIPGVERVSLCNDAPASAGGWRTGITIGGSQQELDFLTTMKMVDEDYLQTFDLKLISGRNLSQSDTVREVLVNETLLHRLGIPSADEALGTLLTANGGNMRGTIVGVVADFHETSFHQQISPILLTSSLDHYEAYAIQLNSPSIYGSIEEIEALWKEHYPSKPFELEYLDDRIKRFYNSESTMLLAVQLFSAVAILIGCLGLYGLVSFMVVQKTKEVGIRKVLGSSSTQIAWLFGKEFSRLLLIAFVVAAPFGWYLMREWLQNFEFKIQQSWDTYALTICFSFLIAAFTVGFQVYRTSRSNPTQNLLAE